VGTAVTTLLVGGLLAWAVLALLPIHRPTQPAPATRPHILAAVAVGHSPAQLAVGSGFAWVSTFTREAGPLLLQVDPRTDRVVARIQVGPKGAGFGDVAAGLGAVWVSTGSTVHRIDPRSHQVVARFHMPSPSTLAVGFGSLWVGDFNGDAVVRVDPESNRPVARIHIEASPVTLVPASGALWVLDSKGSVEKVDPDTSRVVAVFAGHLILMFTEGTSYDLAARDGAVWIAYSQARLASPLLVRIDSITGAVTKVTDLLREAASAIAAAVGPDGVWATTGRLVTVTAKAIHRYPEGVVRIDPTTGRIVQRIAVHDPTDLAVGEGSLWALSSPRRGVLYRIGPIDTRGP